MSPNLFALKVVDWRPQAMSRMAEMMDYITIIRRPGRHAKGRFASSQLAVNQKLKVRVGILQLLFATLINDKFGIAAILFL